MARHDDRQRIAPVRRADSANGQRLSDALRDGGVATSLAVGNRFELTPHAPLEAGAPGCERQLKLTKFGGEVGAKLMQGFGHYRMRRIGTAFRAGLVNIEVDAA